MANEENLVSFTDMTAKQQREIASMGGKASQKKRKERKKMKESLEILLGLSLHSGKPFDIANLESFADIAGKNVTVEQAMLIKQINKAVKGDAAALAFLRDTSGQKSVEQIEVNAEVNKTAQDIEEYVNSRKE